MQQHNILSLSIFRHHYQTDTSKHRVGRVISFSPVGIGTFPTPHPQASVPSCTLWSRGGGVRAHSRGEEGLGESQFRRGDIHCGTLHINVLCASIQSGPAGNRRVWFGKCGTEEMTWYSTRRQLCLPFQIKFSNSIWDKADLWGGSKQGWWATMGAGGGWGKVSSDIFLDIRRSWLLPIEVGYFVIYIPIVLY